MKVKIKIKSTVYDLELCDNVLSESLKTDGRQPEYDSCGEKIEYSAYGEYEENDGRVKISYKEPEETGTDNTVTVLVFDIKERDVLTMVRSGDMSAQFRFDMKNKRQMCSYETPFMPMEFAVNTKKVCNNVRGGRGSILLDYCIEVRGTNVERNRIFIEVRKHDAD